MLTFLLASMLALAEEPPSTPADDASAEATSEEGGPRKDGFGFGALPAVNYNSDEGFGYGVVSTLYWYRGGVEPYRTALNFQIFLTTKWVQAHRVRIDTLDVGGLPLRLTGQIGYYSTVTTPFCGHAAESDCDPQVAAAAADAAALALDSEERDDFLRRFYYVRYTEPYAWVNARWKLRDKPHRVEVFAGYRGSYYFPGVPGDASPYIGSFYQANYAEEGEKGFASVLQVGLMADNRDNEPAPNTGYWVEGSLRGATPVWGSSWTFGGANLTLRGYQALVPDKLVFATRLVGDLLFGDVPTMELVRMGGSPPDYSALGGERGVRGLRQWRYIDKLTLLAQQEVRWTMFGFDAGTQRFDFGLVGFFDIGYAASGLGTLGDGKGGFGTGGGLRIAWNENFIVRVDVGFAPHEDMAMKMYINLDHLY